MKTLLKEKPRVFEVNDIQIKDFGKITLDENEMISFQTPTGKEYDFTVKEWGFYATPSVNGRLKNEGFKTAFVVNEFKKTYVMVVENEKIEQFQEYLKKDNQRVICWLDEWFSYKN